MQSTLGKKSPKRCYLNKLKLGAAMLTSFFVLICALSGCGSRNKEIIGAFEGITTSYDNLGAFKVPQMRLMSLTGMLPAPDAGVVNFYKPDRRPFSAIGISGEKTSYILETTVGGKGATTETLLELREKYNELYKEAGELFDLKVRRASQENREIEAAKGVKAAYSPSEALIESGTKIDAKKRLYDAKFDEFQKLLKNSGVIIMRWNSDVKGAGSVDAGELASASLSREKGTEGVLMVAGLRAATIYLGDDFIDAWSRVDATNRYSNRIELTTFVLQAKALTYISRRDTRTAIEASLSASAKEFQNIPETLKSLDQINIAGEYTRLESLENTGFMGDLSRQWVQKNWSLGESAKTAANGYLTFFEEKSDIVDLIDMICLNKKADFNLLNEGSNFNSTDTTGRRCDSWLKKKAALNPD